MKKKTMWFCIVTSIFVFISVAVILISRDTEPTPSVQTGTTPEAATPTIAPTETLTPTMPEKIMTKVPNVLGMTGEDANATLKKNGFTISIEYEYSNERLNTVFRTEPLQGEIVEYGTNVTVIVSKDHETSLTPTPIPLSELYPLGPEDIVCTTKIGDNITGTLYSNMVYVIRGKGATYDYNQNQPQNAQDEILKYKEKVQKIIIEEGITIIGEQSLAFFSDCKEIVLPKSLEEIKTRGFAGIGRLGVYDTQGNWKNTDVWYTKYNLEDTSLVKIDNMAFENGTIEKIVYPETIKYVGFQAHIPCNTLDTTLIIPASVSHYADNFAYGTVIIKGKTSFDDFVYVHPKTEGVAGLTKIIFEP